MGMPRQMFEFDANKAATNIKKHGISFAEAMTVFNDRSVRHFRMSSTLKMRNDSSQLNIINAAALVHLSSRDRRPHTAHRSAPDECSREKRL
jgi:uncharacterized DUF497 family protein